VTVNPTPLKIALLFMFFYAF